MGSKYGEAGSLQRPRRFGVNQRTTTGKIADLKLKTNEVRTVAVHEQGRPALSCLSACR